MRKIPTIFKRNPENMRELLNEPHPDCSWVFNGEGVATRKYDGTCVKIVDGNYYKRREVKKGKKSPPDFIEEQLDQNTGKRVGWVPVENIPENKYHIEALQYVRERYPSLHVSSVLTNGTYELVGPKVQGNPEKYNHHTLIKHSGAYVFPDVPRSFKGLSRWMSDKDIEGLVFHHPDGRMGKIKKRDFGQRRR